MSDPTSKNSEAKRSIEYTSSGEKEPKPKVPKGDDPFEQYLNRSVDKKLSAYFKETNDRGKD